ncbi:hypothetical protein [Teichococcus aestuarii]|uniref:hypothetical protein n=1 Tax=Teichococcus aestuarii TaxID=568898 RepID=UPI00361B7C34
MPEEKPDPMRLPAHERPGNHTPGRPGARPDPRDQKPAYRPGEPGLQGGPAGAGSTGGTGGSRG